MAEKIILRTSATDETSNEYHFQLPFYVFQENGNYIAYCPSLDLSSSGETFNDSISNFYECFQLYVECCVDSGTLCDDLISHGWKMRQKSIMPPTFEILMKKPEMKKLMESSLNYERVVAPVRIPAFT